MATLRNKRKLGAINKHNAEGHPVNNQARHTSFSRIEEDYFKMCERKLKTERQKNCLGNSVRRKVEMWAPYQD